MKSCRRHASLFYFSLLFLLILLAPKAKCAAPEWETPQFLKTGKAQTYKFARWISIKHIGEEDAPVTEFVLAFGSTTASVIDSADPWPIRVVTLDSADLGPILTYVQDPTHSTLGELPQYLGTFQVTVYSRLNVTESHVMTPIQSKKFFLYLAKRARINRQHADRVKKAFDTVMNW